MKINKRTTDKVLNKNDPAYLKISKDTLWSTGIIVLLLACVFFGGAVIAQNNKNNTQQPIIPTIVPTNIPLISPTNVPTSIPVKKTSNSGSSMDCIGPDGKQFKTTEAECTKLNAAWGKSIDYLVACNISLNCGGGTRSLKKSECDNSTCCQIGSTWIFYPSKDKCLQDQKVSQSVQQVQQPVQSTSKLSFYCYDNTYKYSYYTSSGEQCNKDNAVSACKGLVKSTYDLCMNGCLNTSYEDNGTCVWGYGAGGHVEDNPTLLQQCFDENSADHQKCMDACAVPYQANSAKCY